MTDITKAESAVASRRKFLTGAGVATVAGLAAPSIARAEPKVIKMQAAWGGGIFLENAQSYVNRVNSMAGKDLKIDLLPVNSVVMMWVCSLKNAVSWIKLNILNLLFLVMLLPSRAMLKKNFQAGPLRLAQEKQPTWRHFSKQNSII